MAKSISIADITELEAKELLASIAARRRELDKAFKAFKACMKSDAQDAADKVAARMKTLDSVQNSIETSLAD